MNLNLHDVDAYVGDAVYSMEQSEQHTLFITPAGLQALPLYRLTMSSAKYLDEASDTCIARIGDWYFSDQHMGERYGHVDFVSRALKSVSF